MTFSPYLSKPLIFEALCNSVLCTQSAATSRCMPLPLTNVSCLPPFCANFSHLQRSPSCETFIVSRHKCLADHESFHEIRDSGKQKFRGAEKGPMFYGPKLRGRSAIYSTCIIDSAPSSTGYEPLSFDATPTMSNFLAIASNLITKGWDEHHPGA